MVSSTKGHYVRQLPLGGLLGMKGLHGLCACVYICTPLCVWSQVATLPGEGKMTAMPPPMERVSFHRGFEQEKVETERVRER